MLYQNCCASLWGLTSLKQRSLLCVVWTHIWTLCFASKSSQNICVCIGTYCVRAPFDPIWAPNEKKKSAFLIKGEKKGKKERKKRSGDQKERGSCIKSWAILLATRCPRAGIVSNKDHVVRPHFIHAIWSSDLFEVSTSDCVEAFRTEEKWTKTEENVPGLKLKQGTSFNIHSSCLTTFQALLITKQGPVVRPGFLLKGFIWLSGEQKSGCLGWSPSASK